MPKEKQENWEKEFNENFESEIKGLGGIWESHKIKSFIRQLLLKQEREDLRLCSADILRAQEIERNKCKSEKEKLLERIRLKKWERTKGRDVIATEMDRIMCETRNNTIKELEKLKEALKKELKVGEINF